MTPTGFPATLPAPRRPDPLDVPALGWGVLGTGWIAERFVRALRTSTTQQVVAVGSRSQASAERFAGSAGIGTAHGSPEALVADPGVDIVYVATPHQAHRANALLAIDAGKHVLVEKPMGLDAAQAEEVAAAAAATGVFCMEAMWTLFLPRFDVVRQVLELGVLGDVRTVLADHGERFDPPHRILDPAMAGGSLLDLGSYLTALATWTLGPAQNVYATGEMTPGGVNGQAAMVLTHDGGARSVLHTTLLTRTPTAAVIAGTAATLTLPGPFFMPGDVVLTSADGDRTVTWAEPQPIGHGGLYHSAVEAALRVTAGELESPLRPAADVVAGLRALDEVGRQLGVRYDAARWAGDQSDRTGRLRRLDQRTGTVTVTTPLPDLAVGLAAGPVLGGGAAWLAGPYAWLQDGGGILLRVDPASGQVTGWLRSPLGFAQDVLAAGPHGAWVGTAVPELLHLVPA